MAGETIVVEGTQKTLEANGASIGNGVVVQANDAPYGRAEDGASYPDAEFVMSATYSSAPTEGSAVILCARPIDVDGTADTEVPEAGRPGVFIGAFVVNNVTTLQYMTCTGVDVPKLAEYYLYNTTGQTIPAGWTLKVTPRSYSTAV